MALRKLVEKLNKTSEELHREDVVGFCEKLGAVPIDEITERTRMRTAGEIASTRIVPRAGAPSLEVNINDGRASMCAVFLGRRRIAGLTPGRRVIVEGMAGRQDSRLIVYNPWYQLL